mmetsp:Transcript_31821/g.93033  ORF Transcript_31821/g.93033 Transcript_31821/m.93033 type:complete len:219 (-) Transcript_31821:4-660(-)
MGRVRGRVRGEDRAGDHGRIFVVGEAARRQDGAYGQAAPRVVQGLPTAHEELDVASQEKLSRDLQQPTGHRDGRRDGSATDADAAEASCESHRQVEKAAENLGGRVRPRRCVLSRSTFGPGVAKGASAKDRRQRRRRLLAEDGPQGLAKVSCEGLAEGGSAADSADSTRQEAPARGAEADCQEEGSQGLNPQQALRRRVCGGPARRALGHRGCAPRGK